LDGLDYGVPEGNLAYRTMALELLAEPEKYMWLGSAMNTA
jgi:hypothetical protein